MRYSENKDNKNVKFDPGTKHITIHIYEDVKNALDFSDAEIAPWQGYEMVRLHVPSSNSSSEAITADIVIYSSFFKRLKGIGITTVIFIDNTFCHWSSKNWLAFGRGLKERGLISLSLDDNSLHQMLPNQWHAFGNALQGSKINL